MEKVQQIGLVGTFVNLGDLGVPKAFFHAEFPGHALQPYNVQDFGACFYGEIGSRDFQGRAMLDELVQGLSGNDFLLS